MPQLDFFAFKSQLFWFFLIFCFFYFLTVVYFLKYLSISIKTRTKFHVKLTSLIENCIILFINAQKFNFKYFNDLFTILKQETIYFSNDISLTEETNFKTLQNYSKLKMFVT